MQKHQPKRYDWIEAVGLDLDAWKQKGGRGGCRRRYEQWRMAEEAGDLAGIWLFTNSGHH
jgi:hypothetical protein